MKAAAQSTNKRQRHQKLPAKYHINKKSAMTHTVTLFTTFTDQKSLIKFESRLHIKTQRPFPRWTDNMKLKVRPAHCLIPIIPSIVSLVPCFLDSSLVLPGGADSFMAKGKKMIG